MGGATCASSQISSFGYNVIVQVALSNRSLKGAGVLLSQTIKYFLEESTTILKRNVVLFVLPIFSGLFLFLLLFLIFSIVMVFVKVVFCRSPTTE